MLAIDDPHRFVGRARNYPTRRINNHWISPKKLGKARLDRLLYLNLGKAIPSIDITFFFGDNSISVLKIS